MGEYKDNLISLSRYTLCEGPTGPITGPIPLERGPVIGPAGPSQSV
jgi:hypothetical protein